MTYNELKKQTNVGWNTWNSPSMTSHVLLPYGFCINLAFRDFAAQKIIRALKVGDWGLRPGTRSWDGTYTVLEFDTPSAHFVVESTAEKDEQYLLVTTSNHGVRAPALVVEASVLWGKDGIVGKNGEELFAKFPDGTEKRVYTTGKKDAFVYSGSDCPFVSLTLDEPVAVATVPTTVSEVRAKLDAAREKTLAEESGYGKNAEVYQAMRSCLSWDTIYDPEHDRICSTVSRSWNDWWGGYVLFCWDTYFAAVMSGESGRELAYLNALAIAEEATEDGFIPNYGSEDDAKSRDRSQPPVGSMVVKMLYDRFGDAWFVSETFPVLMRWNTWFYENRRLPDGTFAWGSNKFEPRTGRHFEREDVYNAQGARYESGLDNSPMYDGVGFDPETSLMQLSDVGLTGLFIKDCRALISLAAVAGHSEYESVLTKRLDETEAALETLWNEKTGIYENKNLMDGTFSHRISPTNLYSLFSSRVSGERKRSMCEKYLFEPEELGGEFMLPSISRRDPAYADQNYWRGRIWAPMNFLVYEALCDAELEEEKKIVCERSADLFLKEWREHGHVHENYDANTGWGDRENSNNFYHWGGLLGFISLEYAREKK